MERTLTITLKFDDTPWFAEEEGEWHNTDPHGYALDIAKRIANANKDDFVRAELDGTLLLSRGGADPDEAKQPASPAVDAKPVPHARWTLKDEKGNGVCSHCNRQDAIDPMATHCRYCGAKMDLKDK